MECGRRPVSRDCRVAVHKGQLTNAWVKVTPVRARRSRLGVRACLLPYAPQT
jgi:hypothetical protein